MTLPYTARAARGFYFSDRREAGAALVAHLTAYARRSDVIVLALPRGGVPVAAAVADVLQAPLDVLLVRKLGVPGHKEFAFGALASGGTIVLNRDVVAGIGLSDAVIQSVAKTEQRELERRERAYRDDRPFPKLSGKTVILVDDGLATGSTMYAAVVGVSKLGATRIVIAAPVSSGEAVDTLRAIADHVVTLSTPDPFVAVGAWYEHFAQVSDDEVRALLAGRKS
ncbi:MAG TPA: phosphoribosyltransferase family protein [Gemmatimonadaceae bacterium]|nr:phosphoribosyltransferase family protein [Gemmatimonadaceae bacterium]